jgi:hypothetical protein
MATTRRRLDLETKPTVAERMTRGFRYLTLDPSPRLRGMREAQGRAAKDPTEVIREAWLTVGTAIREALQIAHSKMSSRDQ